MTHPFSREATRSAWAWCGGLALAALLAGAVRVLPWMLDPDVPARAALPFARGVVELAIEAAILVGWPIGWALAAQRFADRGEARAMMLLGESPFRTGLAPLRRAAPLVCILAAASLAGALDASAPGRMAQALVAQGRAACATATHPRTYAIPFVDATWLCPGPSPAAPMGPGPSPAAPMGPGTHGPGAGAQPVLYGSGPGALHSVVFTAKDAHIAGDMRRIDLDDARVSLRSVSVHVKRLTLRGMSPWTHASNVPPLLRMIVVLLAAALAAVGGVAACVSPRPVFRGTLAALVVGAVGPVAALGWMRALERANAPAAWFLLTPIVSAVLPAALAAAKRGC